MINKEEWDKIREEQRKMYQEEDKMYEDYIIVGGLSTVDMTRKSLCRHYKGKTRFEKTINEEMYNILECIRGVIPLCGVNHHLQQIKKLVMKEISIEEQTCSMWKEMHDRERNRKNGLSE